MAPTCRVDFACKASEGCCRLLRWDVFFSRTCQPSRANDGCASRMIPSQPDIIEPHLVTECLILASSHNGSLYDVLWSQLYCRTYLSCSSTAGLLKEAHESHRRGNSRRDSFSMSRVRGGPNLSPTYQPVRCLVVGVRQHSDPVPLETCCKRRVLFMAGSGFSELVALLQTPLGYAIIAIQVLLLVVAYRSGAASGTKRGNQRIMGPPPKPVRATSKPQR